MGVRATLSRFDPGRPQDDWAAWKIFTNAVARVQNARLEARFTLSDIGAGDAADLRAVYRIANGLGDEDLSDRIIAPGVGALTAQVSYPPAEEVLPLDAGTAAHPLLAMNLSADATASNFLLTASNFLFQPLGSLPAEGPGSVGVRLLVISFFNPSAPFPPKARGRWGFDDDILEQCLGIGQ